WHLRRSLAGEGEGPLVSDRHSVMLDPRRVTVDVAEFCRLLAQDSEEAVDGAIELYRGDFLEGVEVADAGFEEWLLMERQRLRQLATEAMTGALQRAAAAHRADRAATLARQLLVLDPHHEAACRVLMMVHAARGESTQALAIYESLRRRL